MFGRLGPLEIIIILAILLLLFGGRGKISELMGDFAKGIKSFKKGLTEEDKTEEPPKTDARTIDHQPPSASTTATGTPVTSGAGTEPRKVI